MLKYFDALQEAMQWLGRQTDTYFVGQTVGCPGTFMYPTLEYVSNEKRLEFPVCESFQMQFSIGLALTGKCVISMYPRQNFLLLALADMVNTLDKIPAISNNTVFPHVIIRVASGPDSPVHPGHQHVGCYKDAFKKMFSFMSVHKIMTPNDALPIYKRAYKEKVPTLIIEEGNFYGQK